MYYLFDDSQIIFVIASAFLLGFVPWLVMIWRTPEARKFIACMIKGGVVVASADDSGQVEIEIATPYGGGQFRAGKNVYGQRKIYTKPRINNPFVNRPSILKGLRRPIFFNYAGKTTITNMDTIAACEVAEATDNPAAQGNIPESVKQWAKENHISLLERLPLPPDEQPKTDYKIDYKAYELWNVSPIKLKEYFSRSMDPGQVDVLLEKENIDGFREGKGTGPDMKKIGMFIVVIAVIGIVGLLVATKLGLLG
jgi:hypothetical protein